MLNNLPNLNRHLARMRALEKSLPKDGHKYFQSITPIDTGNARNKTKQSSKSILGNYDYVNKLNEGYSRQAPNGMTDPTIEFIRDKIRGK